MQNEIKLFDFTNNFCNDKVDLRKHPSFAKNYSKFMIDRVMSMSPKTLGLATFMSGLPDIPKPLHFAFYNAEVDRENIWFDYVKTTDDVHVRDIVHVQEYFECNRERALEYIALMSAKQLETITDMYQRRDKNSNKKVKKK